MSVTRSRPTAPHLTVYKWGPHMLVSILHRMTGVALATAGVLGFVWWLVALASGKEAYATFLDWATWPPAYVIPIGLSLAFFIHMGNGIRHFVMDIGANFELRSNRASARLVMAAAFIFTVLMWTYIIVGKI